MRQSTGSLRLEHAVRQQNSETTADKVNFLTLKVSRTPCSGDSWDIMSACLSPERFLLAEGASSPEIVHPAWQ